MVRSRFAAQMELLNTELIVMGTLCENALEHVMQALQEDNDALNREIIILGKRTEEKEREVENICINLLLKQQPVASDLRQISAALKMITDLSRIGEQAGNIAEILGKAEFGRDYDTTLLQQMATAAKKMVSTSLDAFVKGDLRLAQQVERDDDVVDELFSRAKKELIQVIRSTQDSGEQAIDYLMIAKYFEKIGDHAVNISQWVLFMITGAHEEDTVHELIRAYYIRLWYCGRRFHCDIGRNSGTYLRSSVDGTYPQQRRNGCRGGERSWQCRTKRHVCRFDYSDCVLPYIDFDRNRRKILYADGQDAGVLYYRCFAAVADLCADDGFLAPEAYGIGKTDIGRPLF